MSGPGATPATVAFGLTRVPKVRAARSLPLVGWSGTPDLDVRALRSKVTDRLRVIRDNVMRVCSPPPLIAIIANYIILFVLIALTSCATVPEQKIVTEVKSLPPVSVPVPVRCVKEIPALPNVTIDPNATVLQRYYKMRELIAAHDEYAIRANAALVACAAEVK